MMFIKYLKSKLRLILMLAVFAVIFAVIFFLYRLPVITVLYAALICLFVGGVFAAVDYLSFMRRYRMLADFTASQNDVGLLPEPRTLIEFEYDKALRAFAETKRRELMLAGREADEQTAYFTMWAHQIKIPLSAMGLILQSEDTKTSRELRAQLLMTEQYVQMVLAYLRSDADSTDYVFRSCELDSLVRSALRHFAPMFIRKKLTLDYTPTNIRVLTDEKWLTFVFEQILSNAVKYTQSGSVSVMVTRNDTASDGNNIVLSVQDTGIGIAPEDIPRVFENSFTGYNGRNDMSATGIGLYLSRQVLNKLGHKIEISSKVAAGTRVSIYMPEISCNKQD